MSFLTAFLASMIALPADFTFSSPTSLQPVSSSFSSSDLEEATIYNNLHVPASFRVATSRIFSLDVFPVKHVLPVLFCAVAPAVIHSLGLERSDPCRFENTIFFDGCPFPHTIRRMFLSKFTSYHFSHGVRKLDLSEKGISSQQLNTP